MISLLLQQTQKIGAPWLGIVIPAVVMVISITLTWLLYKRFSKK